MNKEYLKFYFKIKFLNFKRQRFSYTNIDLYERDENIIFIHIPKAAGMSCVKEIFGVEQSNHAFASDYIKQNKALFEQSFSFSITREPLERAISAFYYLKSGGMNEIDKVWNDIFIKPYENFNDFVICGGLENAIKFNAQHFIPQNHFTHQNNEQLVKYIGKIEDISSLESVLSRKLGRKITFPVMNSGKIRKGIVSKEVEERVSKIYSSDYRIFYP